MYFVTAHTITLTPSEILVAGTVGVSRYVENLRTHRHPGRFDKGRNTITEHLLHTHIDGAVGEAAFAKARGVYWNGDIGDMYAPDVDSWQVRTTRRDDGRLIVRTTDADDARFVLVRSRCPNFQIVGWILGKAAKLPEWLTTTAGRPAAWFVPDTALQAFTLDRDPEPPPPLFEDRPPF
jgi:hypothetical protein